MDHNAALVPLYLGATHGYLSRPIDDTWSEAIGRYRAALESAIEYEVSRAPDSRVAMAHFVHQKITALMTQLTARLQTVLRDKQAATNDELVQTLHLQAKRLTGEIKVLLEVLQNAVSQKGLMKGLPAAPAAISTSLLSWVARVADFERAL